MGKYLFIRSDECGPTVKLADSLDEFKNFCHYSALSDWEDHKKVILQEFSEIGIYIFAGNDVHYYIIQHPMWEDIDGEINLDDIKLTVE